MSKKIFFNILIMALIPTLCMYIMVSNMFYTQTCGKFMQFFTIFTFSFAIALSLCSIILKIKNLEKQIKDLKAKLEKDKI